MTDKEVQPPVTAVGHPTRKKSATNRHVAAQETAFGCPRDFLDNRFVYMVVSARARGLSVGVNMNPDRQCNYDCLYCEVDRVVPLREAKLDLEIMSAELQKTLADVHEGRLRERNWFQSLPGDLLQLRHVALSGDGEPTLAPNFVEALQSVIHVRALGNLPFFKIVLITNGSGFDLPHIQEGLKNFTKSDEIWARLDAGTQEYLNKIARPKDITLEKVLSNILLIAQQRPVVIQSLFPAINGEEPPLLEIEAYAHRLRELREAGARIPLVQIYPATRPMQHAECGHLSLKTLSHIAQSVRQIAGLKAEVF